MRTEKPERTERAERTEGVTLGPQAEGVNTGLRSLRFAQGDILSVLSVLSVFSVLPAGAQSLSGRYRLEINDLEAGRLVAELRLDERPTFHGSILLSTSDTDPIPLDGAERSPDGNVSFAVRDIAVLRFTGRMGPRGLAGAVIAGDDAGRWQAQRIPDEVEFYPVLPRFVLRQIVGGRRGDALVVPGALRSAARRTAAIELDSAYVVTARRAGLAPLAEAQRSSGAQRALGRAERAVTLRAVGAALASMRAALPSDSVRRRFDGLFRPRREWIIDIHDAALHVARQRVAGLSWASVTPALEAERWIAGGDSASAVPDALARLRLLRSNDTSLFAATLSRMRKAAPRSADALRLLLDSYTPAEAWHRNAIVFLLNAAWVPTSGTMRRPADLVRNLWDSIVPGDGTRVAALPVIGSRSFGQPQAVPRIAIRPELAAKLLRADNWTGARWLERRSLRDLLNTLRHLPVPTTGEFLLERGDEQLRVTPAGVQARAGLNGFLEPADVIEVDPEYVPLLAFGAVLHEWGHIAAESWRAEHRGRFSSDSTLEFAAGDPFLAEGWAELWTDRVLAPIAQAYPLLAFTEAEKRVRLAQGGEEEPHVLGYLILNAGVRTPADVPALLRRLLDTDSLDALRRDPAFAALWQPGDSLPELVLQAPSRRYVVPETTFTVEDGVADAVRMTLK